MKKITSSVLYELLKDIRTKPGKYIGTKSIVKLRHFLDGIYYVLYYTDENKDSDSFLKGFQEWIEMRYDITSTHHWSSIINFYSNNEADAFDRFYELLDEFLSLSTKEREYSYLLQKKEKWQKIKSDYSDKIEELDI
jgi:hypothetical protein